MVGVESLVRGSAPAGIEVWGDQWFLETGSRRQAARHRSSSVPGDPEDDEAARPPMTGEEVAAPPGVGEAGRWGGSGRRD